MNVALISRDPEWWHHTALRFFVVVDCLGRRELTNNANQAYTIRNALQNEIKA